MHKFRKMICMVLVALITVAPAMALAKKDCCTTEKVKTERSEMKCHEDIKMAKNDVSHNKTGNCKCDCGSCQTISFNLPVIEKTSENYPEKFVELDHQVHRKSLAYGIFDPPKIS